MLIENPIASDSNHAWRKYLTLLGFIVGALVALSFMNVVSEVNGGNSGSADSQEAFATGDRLVQQALSDIGDPADTARKAIEYYEDELPSPAAYRRIGLVKQTILKESGAKDFSQIDSRRATRGLSRRQIEKLSKEVGMWRDIYGNGEIDKTQAAGYISRIEELNLGPLEQTAISDVYRRSGQEEKAQSAMDTARKSAYKATVSISVLAGFLVLLGITGLVLTGSFFRKYGSDLKHSEPPRIQPNVLIISFLAYFLSFVFLSIIAAVIREFAGISESGVFGDVITLALESFAMLGAFALGMSVLRVITAFTREDMHEIGLKMRSLIESIKWGVGGYCAALPFVGTAAWITKLVSETLVKNGPLPEHPIVPVVEEGGWMLVIVVILAAVIAPVVEEVGFRGMLYGALRGKMGVWPAAVLSAIIFAFIHPSFPLQVLPIMVLGIVLAILREKTGSLVPSIICHAINNSVALMLVWQSY